VNYRIQKRVIIQPREIDTEGEENETIVITDEFFVEAKSRKEAELVRDLYRLEDPCNEYEILDILGE